ncbi:MAG: DUF1549 and DUF1553 domain-containing protein [Pirellulales bacterium]|nr:DUF1549 and DUF1553 domain-containing protein [Pirellulales bacterium]
MYMLWILFASVLPGETGATVDFDNDVIAVLTKAGCNTGACHGAAIGRGGFKLSLYGGDPPADYQAIVRELEGRRINLARPDESLIVLKPTEAMEHGGGYRLDPDAAGARRLVAWIEQGAQRHKRRDLKHLSVFPTTHVAHQLGEQIQLQANAHFSDGSTRDVTSWTVFTPEDPASVTVDLKTAQATVLRRGRHIVVARYLNQVVPIEILLPLSDLAISVPADSGANFIDDHVSNLLSTLKIPASPACDDATFLRRVSLDLTGRLPSAKLARSFLASDDVPQRADLPKRAELPKRDELVERLLRSEAFNDYWTLKLAKLLRIHAQPQDNQGALAYHRWLRQQISRGVGYDQITHQILVSSGDSHQVGPANFYRTVAGPREQAELTSELFMGSRLRCANCHNHPLDRWTQDDYHGLAAIFAKVKSGKIVSVGSRGEVTHPRTGENALAKIPGAAFLPEQGDPRQSLAEWLIKPDNPYFAKAIVNRLWKAMMGRGLVEPTDDLRATNPATHPKLLDQLARDFVEHDYDLRHTLRMIATSNTYARDAKTSAANASDDRFYSHALRKPLEPEVLADAFSDVLGVAETYGQQPLGTRAVALFDPQTQSDSLDILGRCSRDNSCEANSAQSSAGLPLKLHLLNGPLLNRRITAAQGRLAQLLQAETPPLEIIETYYHLAFCRGPSNAEKEFWLEQIRMASDAESQRALLEDFVWSLLTCNEFVTNH